MLDNEEEIMTKLKERLNKIEKESKGMIKVHLFDGFKPKAFFGVFNQYPKRGKMAKFNPSNQDSPIYVGGIHVGYIHHEVPWLH